MQLVDQLIAGTLPDPHSLLGPHPCDGDWVVRAWRPDAVSVEIVLSGARPVAARRVHEAGLFEARLQVDQRPFYRLRVRRTEGGEETTADPYSFAPTLGELDLYLAGEGRHRRLWELLGAHVRVMDGIRGVSFAVWAPNAQGVAVVGSFNEWDSRRHPMRRMGSSGIWELFVPDVQPGALYKYLIHTASGARVLKSDPYGFSFEQPPGAAAIVHQRRHVSGDAEWMKTRAAADPLRRPMSIYEVHLASWRRVLEEGNRPLTYRELAALLPAYVEEMGFTHVELMPVMEHPYGASWGYQATGFFAPTSRHGDPDDFRSLVEAFHRRGIGVLLDWGPAHFPADAWALARFDGTALYEHLDPRRGVHPDWGSLIFNTGRHEVRNFLIASALFWLDEFHADGLRLDAVSSMLYLDYSRPAGGWVPNRFGGREDLDSIAFLRELNEVLHAAHPGAVVIAEESTAWPAVSRPTHVGGLGFTFKWNMGWMHDTLKYFAVDPLFRKYYHHHLTFGLLYAWSENFILPLSHDEVVHGKGSLLAKMPGPPPEKFDHLRALYAWMWAHPGKKLLFMGSELAPWNEWNHDASLDWQLLAYDPHRGVQTLVRDLNRIYRSEQALWEEDFAPAGFEWIDCHDSDHNVLAFVRWAPSTGRGLLCVANLSGSPWIGYRLGLPRPGTYRESLNTDAAEYGGSGMGNLGAVEAEDIPSHGRRWSARMTLPPRSVLWFLVPPPPHNPG